MDLVDDACLGRRLHDADLASGECLQHEARGELVAAAVGDEDTLAERGGQRRERLLVAVDPRARLVLRHLVRNRTRCIT